MPPDKPSRAAIDLDTRPLGGACRATCQILFDANDPDKLATLGLLYGQHGDYADAVAPLSLAAKLDPESSEFEHDLGLTYFRLKRYADARVPLERATALRPDFFGSNALLGATLYMLEMDEAAYRVLDHAHQINPQDDDTATLLYKTAAALGQRPVYQTKECGMPGLFCEKRPHFSQMMRKLTSASPRCTRSWANASAPDRKGPCGSAGRGPKIAHLHGAFMAPAARIRGEEGYPQVTCQWGGPSF